MPFKDAYLAQCVDLSAGQPWLLHIFNTQSEVELLVSLSVNSVAVDAKSTSSQLPSASPAPERRSSDSSNPLPVHCVHSIGVSGGSSLQFRLFASARVH